LSFPRKRESIISDTYKFLDSRFRGNDNFYEAIIYCISTILIQFFYAS